MSKQTGRNVWNLIDSITGEVVKTVRSTEKPEDDYGENTYWVAAYNPRRINKHGYECYLGHDEWTRSANAAMRQIAEAHLTNRLNVYA